MTQFPEQFCAAAFLNLRTSPLYKTTLISFSRTSTQSFASTSLNTRINMQGRRVRFGDNSYHSPAFSLSTLPSSAGPITPPQLPGATPYKISYPLAYELKRIRPILKGHDVTRLHALLAYAHHSIINFDLRLPPMTISSRHPSLSPRTLSEAATNPPCSKMTIISPNLLWPLVVYSGRTGYVSVSDILSVLYHHLRVNVTSMEFHSFPSPRDQRRVTSAYNNRCEDIRDPRMREGEKRQGVKRVDFLMGRTRFTGLTSSGPDAWVLHSS